MTILTYRDPAFAGLLRSEIIPDEVEAKRRAVDLAEVYGSCDVHEVASTARVAHSRAVPHAQIPLDPEVILGDSRP